MIYVPCWRDTEIAEAERSRMQSMLSRSRGRLGGRLKIAPSMLRWAGVVVMAAALVAILAGCGSSSGLTPTQTPNLLDPKGPIASKEQGLFVMILIIATIIFVLVTGALLYSIVRFRARPDSPVPRQIAGNSVLEIVWTVVPSFVLFIVLVATIYTLLGLGQPSGPALSVNVIGHQWWWEFQYPAGQNGISSTIVTADELHIPANTVVHFNLISDNVIHSFWVPQLGGKTDVIPDHNNTMWLKADAPGGPYRGECAEFCGTQHAHMDFYVMVDSASDFQNWLAQQQQGAAVPPTSSQAAAGEQVFLHAFCISCHQINGVNPVAHPIGPNLTHFGSRMIIAGGVLDNNPQNLKEWITNAQGVKPGVDMPSFPNNFSPSDLDALVAYLESLK
jgi:cytochrome c oxidase subunit II